MKTDQKAKRHSNQVNNQEPLVADELFLADEEIPEQKAKFSVDFDSKDLNSTLSKIKKNAQYWLNQGRYNKVRISRKGKAIMPDIPVGVLMAMEAATFFGAGLVRAALFNFIGKVFFEIEMINEAEEYYDLATEQFLTGELEAAENNFKLAIQIDPRYAKAFLRLGVIYKIKGQRVKAKQNFNHALQFAETHDLKSEILKHLNKIN